MDENQDISGILDITKCFYDAMEKLERAYASSRKLYDALEGVQSELGTSQPQQIIQYVEALRLKMSGPTLESVLTGHPHHRQRPDLGQGSGSDDEGEPHHGRLGSGSGIYYGYLYQQGRRSSPSSLRVWTPRTAASFVS